MLNIILRRSDTTAVLLVIVLVLSAFIHLWNPVGFPDVFFDEGIYMRRAMHVLNGQGPQEAFFYDHPFFGQIFLAGALAVTGYPNSLNPIPDEHGIETLYLIPRIIMGILAVFDTFLIYKIAEKRYGRSVAVVASLLFAVMPMTWLLRRILLDSILLPFLLSSIYLAIYSKGSKNKNLIVLFSGICLGLAIFTKIPVFTMIPLVAALVYYNNRNFKTLGLWFVPVMLIPLIWPAQSIAVNQFDTWLKDVLWQTQRQSGGLPDITGVFLKIDPVLFILGVGGFIFAAKRRDFFVLLWLIPFLLFLVKIGYTQYFHWIPILPVFCIGSGILIIEGLQKITKNKLQKSLPFVVISGIGVFGFVSTTMLITTNLTSGQFEAAAFVLQYIKDDTDITTLASPTYSWIFRDVFNKENILPDYSNILFGPIETEKILLVADPHFHIDIARGKQLQDAYDETKTVETFEGDVLKYDTSKYPYTSLIVNNEGGKIEVRTNK
jgi:dolichyl-phosphate-mannose--protein O-mannosyl transferase